MNWKPFNMQEGTPNYEGTTVLFLVNGRPYCGEYRYHTGGGGMVNFQNGMVATPQYWMPIPAFKERCPHCINGYTFDNSGSGLCNVPCKHCKEVLK